MRASASTHLSFDEFCPVLALACCSHFQNLHESVADGPKEDDLTEDDDDDGNYNGLSVHPSLCLFDSQSLYTCLSVSLSL